MTEPQPPLTLDDLLAGHAANQNVVAALKGGPVALLAAVAAVAICACCIAVLVRTGRDDTAFAGVPQFEEQ